jgi:hypothetical protein
MDCFGKSSDKVRKNVGALSSRRTRPHLLLSTNFLDICEGVNQIFTTNAQHSAAECPKLSNGRVLCELMRLTCSVSVHAHERQSLNGVYHPRLPCRLLPSSASFTRSLQHCEVFQQDSNCLSIIAQSHTQFGQHNSLQESNNSLCKHLAHNVANQPHRPSTNTSPV